MVMQSTLDRPKDGRRERSADSHRRILNATTELIRDGKPTPTAEAIAARAGVSLRTLFRHFDEMENLYVKIGDIALRDMRPTLSAPLKAESWPQAFYQTVECRARYFEHLLPIKASLDVGRHKSPAIDKQHRQIMFTSRELLVRVFPSEIAGDEQLMQAMDMTFSIETWQRLRLQQGLTTGAASAHVSYMGEALLASAGHALNS